VHNVFAPELARNAMAFKPAGINDEPFREGLLKPV